MDSSLRNFCWGRVDSFFIRRKDLYLIDQLQPIMRKILLFFPLVSLIAPFGSDAQNLVSNPGFENFFNCPNNTSQLVNAVDWISSSYTPDYYHACGGNGTVVGVPGNICGFQQPYSGDGYIGLLCYGSFASQYSSNIREYATGTLTSPLVIGSTYSVSFNVALMNKSSHAVDHLGAKFVTSAGTSQPITNSAHVFSTTTVTDTLNWQTISGTFVADSNYNFIIIGNHFDDANTSISSIQPVTFGWNAYYFVDGIEVVELNLQPVALFTAPNHICPGTCTDFTNLSVNATSYLWNFPGGSPSTSTDINPGLICYNTPGNYSVELIATNSIGSDTLILPNYITVYPYPAPQGISQSGDTLFANAGATSYQWYFNGSIISGATDYFYVASSSGDYNVVCTDMNGCEVEAVIFNVVADINPAYSSEPELIIFPNPVTDHFTFNKNGLPDGVDLSIYNMLGECVYSVKDYRLKTVDCRLFSSGIYYLEIRTPEKLSRHKFMK